MTGFRAAEAFVEVTADLREGPVLVAARRAADGIDRELSGGARRAGTNATLILGAAGGDAGERWTRDARGRLHDERGRFLAESKVIGQGMGSDLGAGMVDMMGRKVRVLANPTMMGAILPPILALAPALGAALGAGIMAGVGTVAIGGGIAMALRDPEIKHAAGQTGEEILDILSSATEPFKGQMIRSLDTVERSFRAWDPWLRRIGVSSAKAMEPLTIGVTGLVTRMLPGLDRALAKMGPLWDGLSQGLVETGRTLGNMFDSLSDNGAELGVAMRLTFMVINGVIAGVGHTINGLTEAFGFLVELAFDAADIFVSVGEAASHLPGPLGAAGAKLRDMGMHVQKGRGQWEEWKRTANSATSETSAGAEKLTERQRLLTQSMGATVREAGSLKAAFDLLNGAALSAREAESNYQAAVDAVTASIRENGKTLDLNTAKGRANDAAIRQLIGSVNAKAQAVYNETLATKGQAAAESAATKVYEQGRAQLVKNLTQVLGNAKAANKLADEIMSIPKSWSTKISNNATSAQKGVRNYVQWLDNIPRTVYTRLVTEQQSARGGHKEFARGGEVTGGSGTRDDVPILAMAREWVIRKSSVRALERMYGPGIMEALNNADGAGWRPGPISAPARPRSGRDSGPSFGSGASQSPQVINIGTVSLDASKIQSIQDVVDLISNLQVSTRSYRTRAATVVGR